MAVLKIYNDIANENDAVGFFGDRMDVFSADRLSQFLADTEDKNIDARVHCRGGSVIEGYTCGDLLAMSGKDIVMTVEGLCASIATVLLLCVPVAKRKIYPHARVLIHNPFIPEYTLADSYEAADLEKIAADMRAEENRLLDYYVKNTTANRDELKSMMDAETELSAEDALKYGFVGEILQPMKALKSNNSFNKFKMDEKQAKELQAKVEKSEGTLSKILAKLGLKLSGDKLAMDLTTSTGTTITVERETGDPQVGDVASPDGDHVMPDGNTIVVSGGKITEIKPTAQNQETEEVKNLKSQIDQLTNELASVKAEKTAMDAKVQAAETTALEAKALVTELKALKSTYKPAARQERVEVPEGETLMQAKIREKKEALENRNKKTK
jgi:ATP-dependent Clp protease protease subunit